MTREDGTRAQVTDSKTHFKKLNKLMRIPIRLDVMVSSHLFITLNLSERRKGALGEPEGNLGL